MSSRYLPVDSFNTGTITAGSSGTFHRTFGYNQLNVVKIKVAPSGSSTGYTFKIYKEAALTHEVLGTKANVIGNFYAPTTKSGGEALEGFVVPYEDLDGGGQVHVVITNNDAVSRNYDVEITCEGVALVGVAGEILAEGTNPRIAWNETDAGTNVKMWDAVASSGSLLFRTRTDADAAGNTWLTISRTTTTVTGVNFTPAVTFSSSIIGGTIGPTSSNQHTLPDVASDTVALIGATQTLVGKTLTSPTINAGALFGTFSGSPTFSGVVTLTGSAFNHGLDVTNSFAGTMAGINIEPTLTANGDFLGIEAKATLSAAVVGGVAYNFFSNDASLGAGASLSTQYGFYAASASAATTNWGFYAVSNRSFFGGNVAIGATTNFGTTNNLYIGSNTNQTILTDMGGGGQATWKIQAANGTLASPTIFGSSSTIASIDAFTYDGSAYRRSAVISFNTDTTVGAGTMSGTITFNTTTAAGANTLALTINSSQLATFTGGITMTGATAFTWQRAGVGTYAANVTSVISGDTSDLRFLATTNGAGYVFTTATSGGGLTNALSLDRNGAAVFGSTAQATTVTATTAFLSANGSVSATGYGFTNSSSTGMYYATGPATLNFSLGGTQLVRLSASESLLTTSSSVPASLNGNALLYGESANVLALKNGTTAQTLRVYGSTTGPSYLALVASNSGHLIQAVDDNYIRFSINGLSTWTFENSDDNYQLAPVLDNSYDVAAAARRVRTGYFGTAIVVGTTPAAAGTVRLENSGGLYWARSTGAAAYSGILLNGSNILTIGSPGTNYPAGIYLDSLGTININQAGNDVDTVISSDTNANALVVDAGLYSGVGGIGIGGVANAGAFIYVAPPAITQATNTSFSYLGLTGFTGITIPSGTAPVVATLRLAEPIITATGTVTAAATLYIDNAPTEGGINAAIYIASGLTYLGGNVGIGTATFGTNAAKVLALFTGTAPSSAPADTVQLYSSDVSAGNCALSWYQEMAPYAGVAVASTTKVPVVVNGTVYYLLATTVA